MKSTTISPPISLNFNCVHNDAALFVCAVLQRFIREERKEKDELEYAPVGRACAHDEGDFV